MLAAVEQSGSQMLMIQVVAAWCGNMIASRYYWQLHAYLGLVTGISILPRECLKVSGRRKQEPKRQGGSFKPTGRQWMSTSKSWNLTAREASVQPIYSLPSEGCTVGLQRGGRNDRHHTIQCQSLPALVVLPEIIFQPSVDVLSNCESANHIGQGSNNNDNDNDNDNNNSKENSNLVLNEGSRLNNWLGETTTTTTKTTKATTTTTVTLFSTRAAASTIGQGSDQARSRSSSKVRDCSCLANGVTFSKIGRILFVDWCGTLIQ